MITYDWKPFSISSHLWLETLFSSLWIMAENWKFSFPITWVTIFDWKAFTFSYLIDFYITWVIIYIWKHSITWFIFYDLNLSLSPAQSIKSRKVFLSHAVDGHHLWLEILLLYFLNYHLWQNFSVSPELSFMAGKLSFLSPDLSFVTGNPLYHRLSLVCFILHDCGFPFSITSLFIMTWSLSVSWVIT